MAKTHRVSVPITVLLVVGAIVTFGRGNTPLDQGAATTTTTTTTVAPTTTTEVELPAFTAPAPAAPVNPADELARRTWDNWCLTYSEVVRDMAVAAQAADSIGTADWLKSARNRMVPADMPAELRANATTLVADIDRRLAANGTKAELLSVGPQAGVAGLALQEASNAVCNR